MQIVIAHSDEMYVERLKSFFYHLDVIHIQVFENGFDLLTHIIERKPKMVLIEENLPGLSANDIKEAIFYKRIKTKLITLHLELLFDPNLHRYSQ